MRALAVAFLLLTQTGTVPIQSPHHAGPHGLEGWTLRSAAPGVDEGRLPFALVIARHSRIVRRVQDDSLLWAWEFQDHGGQVAVESGPLHFSLQCELYDLASGKQLAAYDCFHDPVSPTAPAWVKDLKRNAFRFPN